MEKIGRVFFVALIISILVACAGEKSNKSEEKRKETRDSTKQDKEDKEKSKPKNKIGKYVYIDQYAVTHVSLRCPYINYVGNVSGTTTDDDGNQIDVDRNIRHGSGVERVLLEEYDKELLTNACKSCVDDDMYEYIKKYGTWQAVEDAANDVKEGN